MVVLACLDLAASPIMSLFSKVNVVCPLKEIFFTYSVTVFVSSAAEGICTVMVIVDKVAFCPGEFEVGAVSAQDGKFPPPICSESCVIVGEGGLQVFFCEERFAYWVKYMNKSRTLCTFFSIVFWNGHSMRFVPYERSAACAINVFM